MSDELLQEMDERLRSVEQRFAESGYNIKKIVHSEVKKNFIFHPQAEILNGFCLALCVETIDPWKQNRIRFYSPHLHKPKTPVKALPWAHPISAMGGFDDSGLNWIPPAGSMVAIIHENGNRAAPYYLGTVWHRNRGPDGQNNWNDAISIQEYNENFSGKRNGYLLGKNDGSQVLPPWNTESYNGIDIDSPESFEKEPDAYKYLTYPNIYGFKTPQKHMLKMVDGNYKCAHKDKRIEILSSCGNWMIFKDDHLREFEAPGSKQDCTDEETECKNDTKGGSKFFKHQNEQRPWKGVQTPQNTKCELKQSGIQFISISGHTLLMDDSVDEPSGTPDWNRSLQGFNFGCNNKYRGKTALISATGHRIEMSDYEEPEEVRSDKNYIRLLSASGNRIELNDHTTEGKSAGSKRGITMESTSRHKLEMIDEENDQASPTRMEGGVPKNEAKKAFVRLRTGYGLEITMKDDNSQQETQSQSIMVFSPQKDNKERGPHILRMQETPSGPGQVFVRAGGHFIVSTYDHHITMVGDKDKNPSDHITIVSKDTLIKTEKIYINLADLHALIADRIILLLAGKDCAEVGGPECGKTAPCAWPVLCLTNKGITISDRVFVSASRTAPCASIFHLTPFHKCENPCGN